MNRAEFEQRNGDQVEEAKLRASDHDFQLHFRGVWNDFEGCPHSHGYADGPDRCDAREMRVCILEVDHAPCPIFGKIIEEWREEYERKNQAYALRGS